MACRVLIVEDDAVLRSLFTRVLMTAGYEVIAAENASLAMQYIGRKLPCVLILDVGLPDMNGMELLNWVRQQDPYNKVNIVVITGNHNAQQSLYADYADLFLLKPVSTLDLVNLISRLAIACA